MREITISGRLFALLCIEVSSVVEGSICSAVFAVSTVFALQYLQYLLCSFSSICFALHMAVCSLKDSVQHPSSSCCISQRQQNGRPTSLSLKLQPGRGENTSIHRKRGEEEERGRKKRDDKISSSVGTQFLGHLLISFSEPYQTICF